MNFINQLLSKVKQRLQNRFIRNMGWFGGSEVVIRVSRLVTTVVLARFLDSYDYGLAAIIVTVTEFTHALTRVGVNVPIVQADAEDLDEVCHSAYWFNWVLCISLFIVQCLLSFPIAWFYKDTQLILPICVTGIAFLILPISAVQQALIQRENRLKVTAITNSIQISCGNLTSALLAALGMGMWALVLPFLTTTPIWVYMHYTNHDWRPTKKISTKYWKEIWDCSKNIWSIELLNSARNYLDYMIVGRFLGVAELGLYFFAFNAGLGISLSIVKGVNSALLPHLCEARSNWTMFKENYFSSIKTIALIIIPFVALQASLAPIYVPIVFGQKWIPAVPILILICLSAIPRPFAEAALQLLIAFGRADLGLRWNVFFTTVFIGCLLVGVHWQVFGVAMAVLLIHVVAIPIFVVLATRFVFKNMLASGA